MSRPSISENAQWLKEFFLDNPAATLRDGVRAASLEGHGLPWDIAARTHRELLPTLKTLTVRPNVSPRLSAVPHPPLAQKPRKVPAPAPASETPKPQEVQPEVQPVAQATEAAPQAAETPAPPKSHRALSPAPPMEIPEEERAIGRQKRGPGTEVRRRFLNAYLDKYPDAGVSTCLRALEDTFGCALMMTYVQETVSLARATRAAPPVVLPVQEAAPPPPAPTAPPPPPPATATETPTHMLKLTAAEKKLGRDKYGGVDVRRRYLADFLRHNPDATPWAAGTAIQRAFGMRMNAEDIRKAMGIANGKPKDRPAEKAPPPPPKQRVAKVGRDAYPVLRSLPPPEEEFREMAAKLKLLCELHGIPAATIAWTEEKRVRVQYTTSSTLEV